MFESNLKEHDNAACRQRPQSLLWLLGCDAGFEGEQRLRLRITQDGPWYMALSPLGHYPRLQPIDAIDGYDLRLHAIERADACAQVEAVDLDLGWLDDEGLVGSGWLTLCYKAPLWIEHLLRDLPLFLLAGGSSRGLGEFALCVGDLLLREVVLPEGRSGERQVSCRFDLVSPKIAVFDLDSAEED